MAALGIVGIGQIGITVQDVARAEVFYRDVLGLRHLFNAGGTMTFFDCGGTRLMLGLPESGKAAVPGSILYLRVGAIGRAFEQLAAAGAGIVHEPHLVARMPDHELWLGFFSDGEGNTLSLMEERRAAG